MNAAEFRAEFPVLERLSYLNAGTDGPVPRRGAEAAAEHLRSELEGGRSGKGHFEGREQLKEDVRERLARLLGSEPGEVAITHSTTDGINIVLSALDLLPGDEVLTTDEEHPGLLAPLAVLRRRRGVSVRTAPFDEIAAHVRPGTRLVACSHVSWVSGRVVDARALASAGAPVLLDGAQGLGAVPADVRALGCDYYAAAGQKWLCGPDGSGCLYVRAERAEALPPPWPSFESLADPSRPSDLPVHPGARRLDLGAMGAPVAAWWRAALELLERAGWPWVLARGRELSSRLAELLTEHGVGVAPRGDSTLVSWTARDPAGTVQRLAAAGVVVRDIPSRGLVRASVGAWSSEEEVERLAELAAEST